MATACVPTLTTMGWVTSAAHKFDFAFTDFLLSNYSQSNEFYGSISSLQWIIQKNSGDTAALETESKAALTTHLGSLFDSVEVRTLVRDHPTEAGKQQLIFYVAATDGGVAYNFVKAIEDIDSKTLKIFEINNG